MFVRGLRFPMGLLFLAVMVWAPRLALAQVRPTFEHSDSVSVWGRVIDAVTQAPVDSAVVKLQGMTLREETRTDGRGQFFFSRALPGTYTLTVTAEGYEMARRPVNVLNLSSVTLNSMYNLVVRLKPLKEDASAPLGPTVAARQLKIPGKARKAYDQGVKELHDKNNPKQSMKYFHKALELYPDFDDAYVQLGLAHFLQGQLRQAQQALETANQLYAENPRAHTLLGKVLLQLGQSEEGIGELTQALRLHEQAWNVHLDLGRALLKVGRVEEAYHHARRAHELNQTSMNVHLLYYNACAQRGSYAAALEELDDFVELYPNTSAASRMQELRGELAQAVKAQEN